MDIVQHLHDANAHRFSDQVAVQIRKAIGYLKSAAHETGPAEDKRQAAFCREIGRICDELSLWAQAMSAKAVH